MPVEQIFPYGDKTTIEQLQMDAIINPLLVALNGTIKLLTDYDSIISYYFDEVREIVQIRISLFEVIAAISCTYDFVKDAIIINNHGKINGEVIERLLSTIYQSI